MGIYDRDWYRDHQRKTAGRANRSSPTSFVPTAKGSGWFTWLAWIALLVCVVFGLKLFIEAKRDIPFPLTGQIHWYVEPTFETLAPFTIIAPLDEQVQYVVHLDDWETKAPVAMIPVRGRETARVQIPLGRYRVTMTKGVGWRGAGKLFRMSTVSKESTTPLEFYKVDRRIVGHTIRLETESGNMETRPARR
jgi:hypothetical protein